MRLLGAEVRGVDSRRAHPEGRDQRGDARLGHERAHHALPAGLGAGRASVPDDGARLPGRDRRRGARAGPRAVRDAARPARGLRGRRLQRDRPLLRLPRRRPVAHGRRRGGRPLVAARRPRRALPRAQGGGRRACCTARAPTCSRTKRATCCPRTRSPRASTIPRSVPSTRCCTTRGASRYAAATDDEALAAFHLLARDGRASSPPSSRRTRWPGCVREAGLAGGKLVLVNLSGRGDKDLGILEGGGRAAAAAAAARTDKQDMSKDRPAPGRREERAQEGLRRLRDRRRSLARAHGRGGARLRRGGRGRPRAGRAVLGPAGRRSRHPAGQRARPARGHDASCDVLEAVRRIRARATCPCCSSATSTRCSATGSTRLAADAMAAGVDGVLVTDLPPEEAAEWIGRRARRGPRHRVPGRAHEPRRAAPRGGRGLARLRLRGEPHRRHRRARRDLRRGAAPRAPDQGPDGGAGGARLRHLDAGAGARRRRRWPTEWSWGARSCASSRSTRTATSRDRCDG